ncbi:hypothetical protein C7B16_21125 [Escherichia sp. 20412-1]|nr:hypothetical protein C7B16_21125 [Escherichia sp. 20412-1]
MYRVTCYFLRNVTPPETASCSSGQHFASSFLQISPRDEHPCLPLTLPLTGCVEDFHLLVVLQPPQLKNSAGHGATRHARRTHKNPACDGRDI